MLSEMSDSKKQIPYAFTYMWNLKNKANEPTSQNRTLVIDTKNKQVVVKGKESWERRLRERPWGHAFPFCSGEHSSWAPGGGVGAAGSFCFSLTLAEE